MSNLDRLLHDILVNAVVLIEAQEAAKLSPGLMVLNHFLVEDHVAAIDDLDLLAKDLCHVLEGLGLTSAGWATDAGSLEVRVALGELLVGLLSAFSVYESIAVRLELGTMIDCNIATFEDNLTIFVVGSKDRFPLTVVIHH